MISRRLNRWKQSGSILVLALASAAYFGSQAAMAQGAAGSNAPLETVTVTGTQIRGIDAIGSNVITVTPADIQADAPVSMWQLLGTIPELTNDGAPQGQQYANYYAPSIHELGNSASNATLVLMDGRRLPQGGEQHSQTDPGIIPVIALQRVEVLTDGASSIYGSDAVSGVINFITRSHYDGIQMNAQAGVASGYDTYNADLLAGKDWGGGWVMLAGGHNYQSSLDNAARPFTAVSNYIPFGGLNNASFYCAPASIQPGGTGNFYLSAQSTVNVANVSANAPCDYASLGNSLPRETRDNVLVKGAQTFGNVTLSGNIVYDVRKDITISRPSTNAISATVFQTGPQANPFYQNPPGVTATKQVIDFSPAGLIPLSQTNEGSETFYANMAADWNVDNNWLVSLKNSIGKDLTHSNVEDGLCVSCAVLALNGTTNSAGSLTAPSVAGTTIVQTTLPLTAANALDVWDPPGSTNKTSAAVLASLISAPTSSVNINTFDQLTLSADGTLFRLPAGDLKVAAGVENFHAGLIQQIIGSQGTGPNSKGALYAQYDFQHTVQSEYLEIAIPAVSPGMDVPFIQSLEFDISGRHDRYSDVGSTSNPKYSATWIVVDGLKLTSAYATSFVAPSLDSIGDPSQFYNFSSSSQGNYGTVAFNIPTAAYPGIAGVLPGCAATAVSCVAGTSSVPGITAFRGGGPNLKPQTGNSWSVGTDIAPVILPGFEAEVTFFNNSLKGGVLSPGVQAEVTAPGLQNLFTVCPTGCTAAQIAAATQGLPLKSGSLPATSYFIYNESQANILYLNVGGIDLNARYVFDTDYGHITIGDALTEFLRYHYAAGAGVAPINLINTSGYNANFPAVQSKNRLSLGWSMGPYDIDAYVNYTGGYRDWGAGTVNPVTFCANGNPCGGGDPVKANVTADIHAAYNFLSGFAEGDQVYLDVKDLMNTYPPFIQGSTAGGNGYDRIVASPLGRMISIGYGAKF